MTASTESSQVSAQLLAIIVQLNLKAIHCKKPQELFFVMLNDTRQLIRYDRALLWDIHRKPLCLGISGHTTVEKESQTIHNLQPFVGQIPDPTKIQAIKVKVPSSQLPNQISKTEISEYSVLWLPILHNEKSSLGLWLERWDNTPWHENEIKVLSLIGQTYSLTWSKMKRPFGQSAISKPLWTLGALAAFWLLFLVPIPLRIVAHAEIVAKDPVLVTAPLEGIIADMHVVPGQNVKKDDLLFEYDKRVPLQNLKVAEQQVQITQAELNRALTLGLEDKKALNEAGVLKLQLNKDQVNLDFAKEQSKQLDVKAPMDGVVILDNPTEWRGKPVKIGEKVLIISNPNRTKVRIWIPEGDNITINPENLVKVYLNIDPLKSYEARLDYVSDYSIVSDQNIVSFIADANWVTVPKEARLGLKGEAILYGDNVTLFYWLLRKPLSALRDLIGF